MELSSNLKKYLVLVQPHITSYSSNKLHQKNMIYDIQQLFAEKMLLGYFRTVAKFEHIHYTLHIK